MVCLETTFLVDLLRGKENVRILKDELENKENLLSIATPTIMELWSGAELSEMSEREKLKINELLRSLTILDLDQNGAKNAGEIEAELIRKGKKIETEDIMIAGICIANGEAVVTRDEHFARIAGLRVIKY